MKAITLTVLGTLAVVTLGCGGGGGNPLAKADFLARGNAICETTLNRADEAADRNFTEKGKVPTSQQMDGFTKDATNAVQDQVHQLRKLKPPKFDKDQVSKILDEGQKAVDQVKDTPAALQSQKPFARYSQVARDYGLDMCGQTSDRISNQITKAAKGV